MRLQYTFLILSRRHLHAVQLPCWPSIIKVQTWMNGENVIRKSYIHNQANRTNKGVAKSSSSTSTKKLLFRFTKRQQRHTVYTQHEARRRPVVSVSKTYSSPSSFAHPSHICHLGRVPSCASLFVLVDADPPSP